MARFVSGLTNVMIELHELAQQSNKSQIVQMYFQKHGVSADLQMRVRAYVEATQRGSSMQKQDQEEEKVLQILPTFMRRKVIEETRSAYLCLNPIFFAVKTSNLKCSERMCCDVLHQVWLAPDEQIFSFGEACNCMYVVGSGKVSYLKYSRILARLATRSSMVSLESRNAARNDNLCFEGKGLCEAVLWTHWVHRGDCTSSSHASLFKLQASDFQAVVSAFSVVNSVVRIHASLFVHMLNEQGRKGSSDLFDSMNMLEQEDERANPSRFPKVLNHERRWAH